MSLPVFQTMVSEIVNLLKTHYGDGLKQQENMTPAMAKRFERSPIKFGGNHYEVPCRMKHPQSLGMRDYRTGFPTPAASTDVLSQVRHRYFYGTGDITGQDLLKAKDNIDAFVDAYDDRMEALMRSCMKDKNFQFYLAGDGVYATIVDTTPSGLTLEVDTIKYLREDMRIDIWDTSATVILEAAATAARRVTATAVTAGGIPTVTFNAAVPGGTANGDAFIRETAKAAGAADAGIFFHGLKAIVDDGTLYPVFQNIDSAVHTRWRASMLGNGGTARPLTLALLQQAHDLPEIKSGEPTTMILGSYNARLLYQQLLVSQKRFTNSNKGDGGFLELDYNDKPFVIDVDCQDDRIYCLNEPGIQRYALHGIGFDDTDGQILHHGGLSAGDVYYFFLKEYGNYGTNRRNAHSVITDLEVDNLYKAAA